MTYVVYLEFCIGVFNQNLSLYGKRKAINRMIETSYELLSNKTTSTSMHWDSRASINLLLQNVILLSNLPYRRNLLRPLNAPSSLQFLLKVSTIQLTQGNKFRQITPLCYSKKTR